MNQLTHTSRKASGRKARRIALATAFACLALPAAASADSILYIQGGNVWSSNPDGSARAQLTDGGGWHSPTQADDGRIAAVQGNSDAITVMERNGRPIRTITTPMATSGNGGTFAARPRDLAFSPDGSKLAYSYVAFSCPPASTCTDQQSTFYTASDVTVATPHSVYGDQTSAAGAEWVGNDRTLLGAGSRIGIDDLGPGDYNYVTWMQGNTDLGDPEVTRDGRRLATVFDYGANTKIGFWSVNGNVASGPPPGDPDAACNTSAGDQNHADPSWSPDGSGVAFQTSQGIQLVRFNAIGPNSCDIASDALFVAGGQQPDWGPAEPAGARYSAGGGGTQTTPPPASPVKQRAAISVSMSKATRKALRKGLRVAVTARAAGRITARLSYRGKRLATGTTTAKKAGRVMVRMSKLSAKRARQLKGRKVRMVVSFKAKKGGQVTTVKRTVKVG